MRLPIITLQSLLVALLLTVSRNTFAQTSQAPGPTAVAPTSLQDAKVAWPSARSPGLGVSTLEIAPQLGGEPASLEATRPRQPQVRRPEDVASTPGKQPSQCAFDGRRARATPYLGVSVEETRLCYFQRRESYCGHCRNPMYKTITTAGLEITAIDPSGLAAQAGLRTRLKSNRTDAPWYLAWLVHDRPLRDGDLITGVDGNRVFTKLDFARALYGHRPGDTVFVKVMRRFADGHYKPTTISVKLDKPLGVASSSLPRAPSP